MNIMVHPMDGGATAASLMDEPNVRLMGMLITVSLGIFAMIFLYVLYNTTVTLAGSTVAVLFFICFAFFIVVLKIFKLLNRLAYTSPSDSANFCETVPTISEVISVADRRYSLPPPSYDEATKNQTSVSQPLSTSVESHLESSLTKLDTSAVPTMESTPHVSSTTVTSESPS